jgi:hypothetical protein
MYGKFKLSKAKKIEFAKKMHEIDEFCQKNGISQSFSSDSYYFSINGQKYRVSNHSVETSNARAFNEFGDKTRELYHKDGRNEDTIYIHASKTRIIEIYNKLKDGYILDRYGNIKF